MHKCGMAAASFTRQERFTLLAAVLGSSMVFLDGTVVNVALAALSSDFRVSVGAATWIVNVYTLMLAALILPSGALGDAFGRRRVFGAGIAVFAVASLLCGLAPNYAALVFARALQGVGGALLVPGSLAMLRAVVADERRGRAIGVWSSATSVVTVLGPLLGGALVDGASWRLVFLLNVPLALVVLLALRRVPETRADGAREVDVVGSALVVLGLGAFALGLTWLGEGRALPGGAATLTGVAVLVAFFVWERRAPSPMLPRSLFDGATFRATNTLTFLLYGALGAALLYLPLVLIEARGLPATVAGAALLPLSLALAALSGVFGALADRFGERVFLTLGPILAGVGFALLTLPNEGRIDLIAGVVLLPGVVVLGFGMALTVAPLVSAVMGSVPKERSGVASGVNNAVSRAAGLVAVAAFGGLLLLSFRADLDARLARTTVAESVRTAVLRESTRLADTPVPATLPSEQREIVENAVRTSFVDAFRVVAWCCAVLAVLAGVVGWFGVRPSPHQGA